MSFSLKTFKLGDIAEVQTGPFGSQLHKEDYTVNGTPIITVEHLGDNRIIHENTPYVSDDDRLRLSKYSLKTGDIVFSRVGSVDRRALVSKKEDGWLFSGRCLRVRVNKETEVDPKFLSYFFGLENFKEYVRNIAVGATMPSLNTKILSGLEIQVPDLVTQKKIAKILSSIDDKIELNNAINKNLEEMAQALFKRWFVDFEFPNENGDPYKSSGGEFEESELGLIPNGWRISTLGELCAFNTDTLSTKDIGKSLTYLDTGSITRNVISDVQHLNISTDKIPSRARRKIRPNDIVYSTVRPNQYHYGLIKEPSSNMVASTGFVVLTSNGTVTNDLVYLWLTQDEITEKLQSIAEGSTSTYPSIKPSDISSLKISLPCNVNEFRVVQMIEALHNQIWDNQKQNRILSDIRDSLLPKLMSGEIRVPK